MKGDSVDPNKVKLTEADFDKLVTLKVKGVEKEVSLKEAIAQAQKNEYVDQLIQENLKQKNEFELTKQAEQELYEIGRNLKEGVSAKDQVKLKQAFVKAGFPTESVEAMFNPPQQTQDDEAEDFEDGSEGSENVQSSAATAKLAKQLELVQQRLDLLAKNEEKRGNTEKRRSMQGMIDQAIDSDPFLSKLLETADEGTTSWIRQNVYSFVAKASESQAFGPKSISTGLSVARQRLASLRKAGSEGETDDLDEVADFSLPGVGSNSTLGNQLHRKREVKPVGIGDSNYSNNLLQRLAQGLKRGKR